MHKCIAAHAFDDFVGWATHQKVFLVACNLDSETLVALQTVKTVPYPNKNAVLTPISFHVLGL